MKLFGTVTSPYVRRVRIVAAELGEPVELVDTATDAGQAALRAVAPLWKVPTAIVDGQTIFDSHLVVDHLLATRGPGPFAPPADAARDRNLAAVIDGALDASINAFYLKKDGADPARIPYLAKQLARVGSALAWVDAEVAAGALRDGALTTTAVSLVTAVGWMRFRAAHPVADYAAITRLAASLEERPSFASTVPFG
jgi:glutathione S-transferase